MAKRITGARITASEARAILRDVCGTSLGATVRNIESYWSRATPADIVAGAEWYATAGATVRAISDATGYDVARIAAVVAQLSPRTTWQRNIDGAWHVATGAPGSPHGCIGANVARARAALAAPDPLASVKGPKVSAFARALLGDSESVTVDVWAARIALNPKWRRGDIDTAESALGRAGVYEAVAYAYRVAGARQGVAPATVQAVTWIVARNGRAA